MTVLRRRLSPSRTGKTAAPPSTAKTPALAQTSVRSMRSFELMLEGVKCSSLECRRRVRLRRQRHPVALLDAHGGAEHAAVRERRRVRAVLRAAVRQLPVVQPGFAVRRRHRHQPLPAQLEPPQRQRRLVQPAAEALRHGAAVLPHPRAARGGHRPRAVPPRPVPALRRGQVLRAGQLLLAPALRHERRRQRRRRRPRRQEGRRAGLQLRARVAQLGHHVPGVRRARQQQGPRRQDDHLQLAAEDHRRRRRHHRRVVHWTLLPGIQQLLLIIDHIPS